LAAQLRTEGEIDILASESMAGQDRAGGAQDRQPPADGSPSRPTWTDSRAPRAPLGTDPGEPGTGC